MRRTVIGALLIALLLSGCGAAGEGPDGAAPQTQLTEIRDAAGEELLHITDGAQIEEFVCALETESWLPAGLPEDAGLLCTAELYQEQTVKLGQTQPGGWTSPLRLEVYEGGVIAVELLSATMAFELTQAAAEYLEGLVH